MVLNDISVHLAVLLIRNVVCTYTSTRSESQCKVKMTLRERDGSEMTGRAERSLVYFCILVQPMFFRPCGYFETYRTHVEK